MTKEEQKYQNKLIRKFLKWLVAEGYEVNSNDSIKDVMKLWAKSLESKPVKTEMIADKAMADVYKGLRKSGCGDPYDSRLYLGDGVWLNADGTMDVD